MVMLSYLVLEFSSDLKGLERERKRSEKIRAPVVPAHQKHDAKIEKKSVKLFDETVA